MMKQFLFLFLASLTLICASALADPPDVLQVENRIGEEIEFQDEVKAVSYSHSTNGFYLSFGAAYPAQVLSVWVRGQLYDQLPANRELVGRTARVRGKLEKSPSGPLLKLESLEQFQILEAEETVLAKPLLDGKMDRDQFKAAVVQTFGREDFAKLEVLAEELRQSRERLSDGTWLSDAFFSAFALPAKASDEDFRACGSTIEKWEKTRPGSAVALLVSAGFHRDLAWRARGNGLGKTGKPERREVFKRELGIARQLLESHAPAKVHPEYFAIMQSIALAQGWSKEDYFRLFSEAIAAERDYYKFYFYAAEYLTPQWHGENGEWEAFAELQRQQHGAGGAGDALYARIAWAMKSYCGNFFRDSAISWEVMASGLEYLMKQYPESRALRNAYANFAWKADDRVRLRKALPLIRDDPDMNVWVNLENFAMAERFAYPLPDR